MKLACPSCGKHDAMAVNDEMGLFFCFRCNQGGSSVNCPPADGVVAKTLSWLRGG